MCTVGNPCVGESSLCHEVDGGATCECASSMYTNISLTCLMWFDSALKNTLQHAVVLALNIYINIYGIKYIYI